MDDGSTTELTQDLALTAALSPPHASSSFLQIGTAVQLHSLVGRVELNGRGGHVASHMASGRVGVQVDGVLLPMAIKGTNIEGVVSEAVFAAVGTSALASDTFVKEVATMVNQAYGRRRLDPDDVIDRLEMGDDGEDANRVLHLAWRSGKLVGCCSSTLAVGWAPQGCGHWGLLAVDPKAQGSGVARALVTAAESRLMAAGLAIVQIEYDFIGGDPLSKRLFRWYEGKLNFVALSGQAPTALPGQSEFRHCRKRLL